MEPLESELERAKALDIADLADAIESIGFECTRCGACCKGYVPADDERTDGGSGDGERTDGGSGDDESGGDECHDESGS